MRQSRDFGRKLTLPISPTPAASALPAKHYHLKFRFMKTWTHHRHCLPTLALILSASICDTQAQPSPPATPPAAPQTETPPPAQPAAPTAPPPSAEDAGFLSDADLELLGKAAERFVEAFNTKDAAAIAALFQPLGEIVSSSGATYTGREEIEAFHAELFADEMTPLVALEAESVRLVAPGVVVEDGVIHLTTSDEEPVTSVSYSATHAKQPDGSWLIATSRNQSEVTPPAERLKPLHWLVGEWTLEGEDGLRVDMVLDLDDSGNYLLGESLVTDAEGDSQSTHLRIGWNPATASIYWWTFDSTGGFTAGTWARNGSDWTIATTGFTADAEANSATQTLSPLSGDLMVWTATDRLLVDETLPDVSLHFVRRAPDPDSGEDEPESSTDAEDADVEAGGADAKEAEVEKPETEKVDAGKAAPEKE